MDTERTTNRPSLALGGFMGVGKTTVGRSLSARVGLPFVDTDAVITERFGPISEQFAREGEDVFRARERVVVAELRDVAPCVIATGGGLWVDPANRAVLRTYARLVVLHAPIEVIRRRVGDDAARPLRADLEERLAQRQIAYADAELRVETATRSVDAVVDEILAWWRR